MLLTDVCVCVCGSIMVGSDFLESEKETDDKKPEPAPEGLADNEQQAPAPSDWLPSEQAKEVR